jgi:hypothetical protein
MKSGIIFMELFEYEQQPERKFIIQKMKRISVALDKGDYWNTILLAGLLGITLGSLLFLLLY